MRCKRIGPGVSSEIFKAKEVADHVDGRHYASISFCAQRRDLLHTFTMPVAVQTTSAPGGIKAYYQAKIEAAEITINRKTQNLRRLEAQRNALNARGEWIADLT